MRGVDRLVVELLHIALLIFRGQQRQEGRGLVDPHPLPPLTRPARPAAAAGGGIDPIVTTDAGPVAGGKVAGVEAVPIGRCRLAVLSRAAAGPGLGEQSLVVGLGALVGIGADDLIARKIQSTVAPGRRRRWSRADLSALPDGFDQHARGLAAEVPRVGPQGPILVEILGREHVHGQRMHARGRLELDRRPRDRTAIDPGHNDPTGRDLHCRGPGDSSLLGRRPAAAAQNDCADEHGERSQRAYRLQLHRRSHVARLIEA